MSFEDIVVGEDRLDSLRALRNKLAREIDTTNSAREVASLSARMMDVLEQIEQVAARQAPRSSARDEIAARRAARAKGSPRSRSKAV